MPRETLCILHYLVTQVPIRKCIKTKVNRNSAAGHAKLSRIASERRSGLMLTLVLTHNCIQRYNSGNTTG